MIPKKIHYCWFGGKELPKELKKYINSWKKLCPDYEIIRWDESNFDVRCSKFISDAYDAKAWAFVSDYARLKIIYENGGIYLDTDVELVKNLDELLVNKCYFAQQQAMNYINSGLGFGAERECTTIKKMLDKYDNLVFDNNNRIKIQCPILNTNVINEYGKYNIDKVTYLDDNNITIYPAKYFDPIAPGESKNLLCKDTISIHHYSASWTKSRTKIKRKIVNMIGQNRINKIKRIIKRGKK